jgi:outer membrane receptor protein involved in Fe transport
METPQSISVVTADQIKIQAAQTVGATLRYTSGVIGDVNGGADTRFGGLQIRGFDTTQQGLYLDGLRLPNTPYVQFLGLDPYGAERIELLKGPSSVMFGGSAPAASSTMSASCRRPSSSAKSRCRAAASTAIRASLMSAAPPTRKAPCCGA